MLNPLLTQQTAEIAHKNKHIYNVCRINRTIVPDHHNYKKDFAEATYNQCHGQPVRLFK
jgi:hypothetical protein